MYRIIGLLLAFVWITGCASRPTAETATGATALPTPELRWSVSLTQSGGIMGLMRSIEINSDGEFSATDERLGKTVSGKLTEDELAELQMLVTNLKFTEPPRPNAVCADCFVYDFQIQTGGKTSSIQLDDITLPNSGLELLAASLVELLNVKLR
ncbi:MAG: hypothetical protein Q8L87_09415 [Anaerolineales bacterium]|nr:hypothetical protein [Anaerolineales bacterium]